MSRSRRFPAAFVFTIGAALSLIAMRPVQAQETALRLSPDTIHVIAKKIRNDAGQVEWYWAIYTKRDWSGSSSSSQGDFELRGSSTPRSEGSNVYNLFIETHSGKDNDGKPRLYLSTRVIESPATGSGVKTQHNSTSYGTSRSSSGGGENPLLKPLAANKVARALFTGDKVLTLPVKLPLYERTFGLDGTGKVTRQVSYLIVGK